MATISNWNLTRQYGFKTTKKWNDHQTKTLTVLVVGKPKSTDVVVVGYEHRSRHRE